MRLLGLLGVGLLAVALVGVASAEDPGGNPDLQWLAPNPNNVYELPDYYCPESADCIRKSDWNTCNVAGCMPSNFTYGGVLKQSVRIGLPISWGKCTQTGEGTGPGPCCEYDAVPCYVATFYSLTCCTGASHLSSVWVKEACKPAEDQSTACAS